MAGLNLDLAKLDIDPDRPYSMSLPKLGHAVIINNVGSEKAGSRKDVEALQNTYKTLGFEVHIHSDCNEKKMREIKRWILKDDTHRDSNCVAITLICHGDEKGRLLDRDKKRSWIIEDFVGDLSEVETLLGKPKILVVQSCRGRNWTEGRAAPAGTLADDDYEDTHFLPDKSDMFIAYAAVPGYRAYGGDESTGSPYLQAFAKFLREEYMDRSLDRIYMMVKQFMVKTVQGNQMRQSSEERNSLTHLLKFSEFKKGSSNSSSTKSTTDYEDEIQKLREEKEKALRDQEAERARTRKLEEENRKLREQREKTAPNPVAPKIEAITVKRVPSVEANKPNQTKPKQLRPPSDIIQPEVVNKADEVKPEGPVAIGKGKFSNLLKQFSGADGTTPPSYAPEKQSTPPPKQTNRQISYGGKSSASQLNIEVVTTVDMGNVKAICPMIDGNLLVYTLPGSLKVYNKHGAWLNKEFPMPCEHPNDNEKLNMLHLKIGYKPYVVFLCSTCIAFYLINPVSKQSTTAWKGDKGPHDVICRGPDSSLFVKNGYTGIVWKLDCSAENFKKIGELAVGLSQIAAMTFEQSEDLLIVSNHTHSRDDIYVKAVKVETGEAMWKIGPGQVGDKFPILGMCNNGQGVVLLAQFNEHCIIIVDAKTGTIVKQELKENNNVKHPTILAWFDNQPNFAMKQLNGVSFCRIE